MPVTSLSYNAMVLKALLSFYSMVLQASLGITTLKPMLATLWCVDSLQICVCNHRGVAFNLINTLKKLALEQVKKTT